MAHPSVSKSFSFSSRFAALIFASATLISSAQAALSVSLTASLPSGQPVGTQVTFSGKAAGGSGSTQYRFEVMPPGGAAFSVMRDFNATGQFPWAGLIEGAWQIRVTAMDSSNATAQAVQSYNLLTRISGGAPAVSSTQNPLVALYSAPPCSSGLVQVRYRLSSSTTWQNAPAYSCKGPLSLNFYVAGMRPASSYILQQINSSGGVTAGPQLTFVTGSLPFTMPATTLITAPNSSTSSEGVLLTSFVTSASGTQIGSVATDLAGNPIWYYAALDQQSQSRSYYTRPVFGGTGFAILRNNQNFNTIFREFDLAGNIVRETNAARVAQQLKSMGKDGINFFSHEGLRLANGHTLTLGSAERLLTNVQGPGTVDVLGDVVIDLDQNFQVAWAWSTFDHLDQSRAAVLGESCQSNSTCGPLYLAATANDWTHCNSINYLAADGSITVSSRNQDWVFKIDYNNGTGTGNILWRMGNQGDFTINSTDPYPWFTHQHDFNFDGTNYHVFDNGNTRVGQNGGNSRGMVLSVNEAARTVTPILAADLGFYAFAWGSSQRLANGDSQFMAGGLSGVTADQSLEVTAAGVKNTNIQFQSNAYRGFRMKDLWTPDDFVAPTTPSGLAGSAVSSTSIALSWNAANDNTGIAGYKLYRNGVLIATTSALAFTDTGLTNSTTYTYTVLSYDFAGNSSPLSAGVAVQTSQFQLPPPSTLVATAANVSWQVNLTWTPSPDPTVIGYNVLKAGTRLATTTTSNYTDIGLFAATAFSYTVTAFDVKGNVSVPTNVASATTITGIPWRQVAGRKIKKMTVIIPDIAAEVGWSTSPTNTVLADLRLPNGYFALYTMNFDGTNQVCISCAAPGVPQRNNGNAAWHPSGKYIVFEAQNPNYPDLPSAYPGAGINDDIWIMNGDGTNAKQITFVASGNGVVHPHFNHRGDTLIWAEKVGPATGVTSTLGRWVIRIASYDPTLVNSVYNIQTYEPVTPIFYETFGFSNDDTQMIFSANMSPNQTVPTIDVFTYNFGTQALTNLTNTTSVWDEHAHFNPVGNGSPILWMSSQDLLPMPNFQNYIDEYWWMNVDGTNKTRMTYFNDPTAPEYIPTYGGVAPGDVAWSPDGTKFLGLVVTGKYVNQQGSLILFEP